METNPFLTRWVLTGIVRPKIAYGAMEWANKVTNNKKQLERVQRLGLLAMVHARHSTPTAGLEAILDVMLLDLFMQCAVVQMVLRVGGRNQHSWAGIRCSHLRWYLFWGDKLVEGMELEDDCTDKRKIKDFFYGRWEARWNHLPTCHQTKFWLRGPGGLGELAWITQPLAWLYKP